MKNLAFLLLMSIFAVACKSSGNGGGAPGYTHNELAEKFVRELNLDPDFNVSLVKSSTYQSDYIVIYDPYTGTYDAIDIYSYNPAYDNAADYYYDTEYSHFYGLIKIPGYYDTYYEVDAYGNLYLVTDWIPTEYYDPRSGISFEKTQGTPKDLAKVAAMKEVAKIEKTAKHLSSSFGLSLSRAKEVARLNANWKKASMKAMTDKEIDNFSTELLGFSITKAKETLENDATDLGSLIDKAADTNNITPEHAGKLMSKVFGL